MNFLFISYDAIKELTSVHQLQSSDFNESLDICKILKGELGTWKRFNIIFSKAEKGGFFFTTQPDIKKGIVFDLTTFKGFESAKNDQLITIFQKTLKFAIRYFEKLPPTTCERHLPGTSFSLVYPFPWVATKDVYRITVDRDADSEWFAKRLKQYLLVFADGGAENIQKPSYTILHKAAEEAINICRYSSELFKTETANAEKIHALKLTQLEPQNDLSIISNIGFSNWQHYLTNNQKEFIFKPVSGPERLEGAAGTGKTLTMILRCINLIKENYESGGVYHILFITHSISTRNQILDIFRSNFEEIDLFLDKSHSSVSVTITTLQEWCITFLGANIGSTEYLDRDAQDSKTLQKMYLDEAVSRALANDYSSFKLFCSENFLHFFENTDREELLEMIQHEVAVTIKGRANEDKEKYLNLPRLKYSIPCTKEGDLSFLFLIYQYYQEMLKLTNQFDSDDIIISSLGQLNTPIWRRRREKEGFTATFVDETHLFNLNELSIFHYLNKESYKQNIVFTIDKSQAVGDRGLVDDVLFDALGFENLEANASQRLNTIFRSSPEIVNLAFTILSSGATLFTNFENPLEKASFNFTEKEEKKSKSPRYILKENDDVLIKEALLEAEKMKKELETQNSKILIISTTELLLNKLEQYTRQINKPVELLKSRGDLETVKSAIRSNRFLIAGIDYVGGLEFDGVIIVGVDKGRVPPMSTDNYTESSHFLNYAWHNRMYVAITRAKYALIIMGEKSRGDSKLLESAIENELLKVE
ncbi:MAG: UvrD-helicase domain-containing protein [Saprospiraceae bacterium]|nr:UvrD-helicase domain-containing protein [Saprospiraceae bacterium]